ncbi:MAG: AI-2E family transporter [Candidatus ainarchaeum sp.]|nr:AI-2E family transporter [Candidatus ainarchaeum sp.]MDD3976313.1 AI-2E family transporter [Candidatus ainarchaeum sp.]
MNKNINFNKIISIILLSIIGLFLIYYLYPYINGFLGAIILATLFIPLQKLFVNKFKINSKISAIIIIILTLALIIIPSFFIIKTAYIEGTQIINNTNTTFFKEIKSLNLNIPLINFDKIVLDFIPKFTNWITHFFISGINNVVKSVITIIIMYFVLFYLLVYYKENKVLLKKLLPFNNKNSDILLIEFKKITYATIIATGLVAVFQGFLLSLSFYFLGINYAVYWGILAAILSFLPVVGIPLIWIPYAIFYLLKNNIYLAIAIIVIGLFINYSEYFIRPLLQKKMGNLHPLVSIIGIFVGIPAFGIIGIVIGPLLISYFILIYKIFKEEYIYENSDKKNNFEKKN